MPAAIYANYDNKNVSRTSQNHLFENNRPKEKEALFSGTPGAMRKTSRGFPGGPVIKNSPRLAMQGTWVLSLAPEDATGQLSPCNIATEPTCSNY